MSEQVAPHPLASLVEKLSVAAELEPPAIELVDEAFGPREFLAALDEAEQHVSALKFLAHLLPPREAVWWAWMCASHQAGDDASDEVKQALLETERWVSQPTDEHRRAAMAAGEVAGFETPAGVAALAAFLSGGSLAPPELEVVPPPHFGAARAVFGSLLLSALSAEPEKAPELHQLFYRHGTELADRIALWDSLVPIA